MKLLSTDKIMMTNPLLGEREFTVAHAERILHYDLKHNKTNWSIFDTEKYKVKNGKIILSKNSGTDKDSEEQRQNS